MRRQAVVIILVGILISSTNFTIFNSELNADIEESMTSIGNMPKNIAGERKLILKRPAGNWALSDGTSTAVIKA